MNPATFSLDTVTSLNPFSSLRGLCGRMLAVSFPALYFMVIDAYQLAGLASVSVESTYFNRSWSIDNRPALLIALIPALMISAMWPRKNVVVSDISSYSLVGWVAFGAILSLACQPEELFHGWLDSVLLAVLVGNALYFACLLSALACEVKLSLRVWQYLQWFIVLVIYYYCIWTPPLISIRAVRWFAVCVIGSMYVFPAIRIHLKNNEHVKYLTLMTWIHAAIMILSGREILE